MFDRPTLLSVVFSIAGLCSSFTAQAQGVEEPAAEVDPLDIPPENDPLAHAWDRPGDRSGFYLRASTAIGVHNTYLGPAPWEDDVGRHAHGFGSGFGLDVGYLVSPRVALHLDSTVGILWNGNVHEEVGVAGDVQRKARVVAYGFAPAATFFTPHDFFIKTAFGVGLANVKQRDESDVTNPGFYMDLMAGKDIIVSDNVAIGLSFQVVYMLLGNDSNHDDARVRQYLFGVSAAFDSI